MDSSKIYTRTAKAISELAKADSALGPNARKLLELIDGAATLGEVQIQLGNISLEKLGTAVGSMVDRGYLKDTEPEPDGRTLDFTQVLFAPTIAPTPEAQAQAEQQTIAGMRTLKEAGFYVNILSKPGKPMPPRSGSKHSIVIIDNDEGHALMVARELLLAGFHVRSASKQQDIVAELNKPPLPDAVLMDTELQGLSGLSMLAKLRQHALYKSVPVVIVTGKHDQQNVVAALARGANGYMTKPIKGKTLVDSVQAVLGLK